MNVNLYNYFKLWAQEVNNRKKRGKFTADIIIAVIHVKKELCRNEVHMEKTLNLWYFSPFYPPITIFRHATKHVLQSEFLL